MDHRERFSASDSDNLASREVIEMSFENVTEGDHGLIIGCRQTLLTTYLFYQSLAYLGKSAGYFAAKIENGDKALQNKVNKVWEVLGGIEIFIRESDGKWKKVDQIGEMGPLATDVHLVKLPFTGTRKIDIKLRLTKGLWRIDYLALGKIEQKIDAIIIEPSFVVSENCANSNEKAKALLKNPDDPLVTLPGDTYDLVYSMPDISSDYEIYLHSKGYYIEWMRETWLAEENHKRAALLFGFPKLFMKMAANDFKNVEPSMEESFWNSKYVKKN